MDWTILSFLNKVFVLVSTSYFENAVCVCGAQKYAMQNKNLWVNAKNDVSVTFEMAWHAIFKNRANQHVFLFEKQYTKKHAIF